MVNVHPTIKQYFLYYKYNLGNIQEGAIIESIISNRINNKTKKVYINLNINNQAIKNQMYKNNTLFDILQDDKNPIPFIYLSNKHTNKVLVKKIYTIDNNDKEEEYELSSSIDDLNVLEFSKKIEDIPTTETPPTTTTEPTAPTTTTPPTTTTEPPPTTTTEPTAPTTTETPPTTTTGGNKDETVDTTSDIVSVNKREETSTRIKNIIQSNINLLMSL